MRGFYADFDTCAFAFPLLVRDFVLILTEIKNMESQTCFIKIAIILKIFNELNQSMAFMVAVGVKQ